MKKATTIFFLFIVLLSVDVHFKSVDVYAAAEKSSAGIRFTPSKETPSTETSTQETTPNKNEGNHSQTIGQKKYPQTNDRQIGSFPIIGGIVVIIASIFLVLLKKRKRDEE